ncbi:MAG: proton-conducting transporter membrane subunit, partial [Hansschlegelia sp.]
FVTIGIFTMTPEGMQGAVFQMVSHGVVAGALFLCAGVIVDRTHTREIAAFGGLVSRMPWYAAAFMVFTMANVGLPGTSGFVGEFLTLLGSFRATSWVAFLATSGVILSAAYALWLYRRVVFGRIKPGLEGIPDLSRREVALLAPLAVVTVVLGVWPNAVLDVSAASVGGILQGAQIAMDEARTAGKVSAKSAPDVLAR